jgi:hypothetical protein
MKTKIAVMLAGLTCASAAMAQGDGLVYAHDLRGVNEFLSFDPANAAAGATTIDGGANADLYNGFAMDFNSAADTLYYITDAEELGTVNIANGAYSPITTLSGDITPGTDSVGGLSVDPTNETFYISTTTNLYTMNPATGVASLVGAFGSAGLMIDIAIDANGNMYGHDISDDSLYSIDKNTGAATLIGSHGLAANFAQGMDFDYATNTLYAAIYTGGGTGQFVSWNLNDGSVNQLASLTTFGSDFGGAEMEMAIRSAIPAPASVAALGMLGLASTRRRR